METLTRNVIRTWRIKPIIILQHLNYSCLNASRHCTNKKCLAGDTDRISPSPRTHFIVANRNLDSIHIRRSLHRLIDSANLNNGQLMSLYNSIIIIKCRSIISMNETLNVGHFYIQFATSNANTIKDTNMLSDSDDDEDIKAALDSMIPAAPTPKAVKIVPGKGPPPEPPIDCCMSGCANCVWIQYAEELKKYYSMTEGNEIAKEAIEQIENPGLQMFLKVELGLL